MYIERVQSDEQRALICLTAPFKLPKLPKFKSLRMAPLVLEDLHRHSIPFLERYDHVKDKTIDLRRLVVEKNEILETLKIYVRHARSVLEKRVVRKEMKRQDLEEYGWRAGHGWCKTSTQQQWVDAAFSLVKGNELSVKLGKKPLVEPDAFEIEALAKRAFDLTDRGLVLENELRDLEALQKPVRRQLDIQIRHLKSMIIRETFNDRGIWRIMLRTAGYQVRYHTQEKEPELDPDGNLIKPRKRRTLSRFQRKYKKPRNAVDEVAKLLKEARQQHEGTVEPAAATPTPQPDPEQASPKPTYTLRYDPGSTKQTYKSQALADKNERAHAAEVPEPSPHEKDAPSLRGNHLSENDDPPKVPADDVPPKKELATKTERHKPTSSRKTLTAAEREKKKAKRKQEKQSRKRNR